MTAAIVRKRIADMQQRFGTVGLQYSGGKDSDTLLHICEQAGLRLPVAYFDPEFVHPETAQHAIARITASPAAAPAIVIQAPYPLPIGFAGDVAVAWEPGAAHLRPRHPGAVEWMPPATHWCEFFTLALTRISRPPMPICWLNGTRAAEGYSRATAIRKAKGFVMANSARDSKAWVMHDWTDTQVWQHIERHRIAVSPEYEMQERAGIPRGRRRTGIDVEDTRTGTLDRIRETAPEYHAALLRRVPQLAQRHEFPTAPPPPHKSWLAALTAAMKNPPHGKTPALKAARQLIVRHCRVLADIPIPEIDPAPLTGISLRWLHHQIHRNADASKMHDNAIAAAIKANHRLAQRAGMTRERIARLVKTDPSAIVKIYRDSEKKFQID